MSEFVSYRAFGAAGDGKTNDIAAIIRAHEYANEHGLPVKGTPGDVYYIGDAEKGAVVMTDCDFTGCTFFIDDSVVPLERRAVNLFTVVGHKKEKEIRIPYPIARGTENLGVTFPCRSLVTFYNDNVTHYIREGLNQDNGSPQCDTVAVSPDGTVDPTAPVMWDYETVTRAYAMPIDDAPLTLRGGTFVTKANTAPSAYTYYSRGICVNRSNVTVTGLHHTVEGELDHGAPYAGILQIHSCADILVENCVFTAHRIYSTIGSAGKPVGMGSYDLNPSSVIHLTIRNCRQTTDILDTDYWGIMGSNYCKDTVLENCVFSRFDAHEGVVNVTARSCVFGWQCFNAIGSGTILCEDSTFYGYCLINLRSDYGSVWDGDAIFRRCVWIPSLGGPVNGYAPVFGGWYSGHHDFGYPCGAPRHILIDGLLVDDSHAGDAFAGTAFLGAIIPEESIGKEAEYPYRSPEEIVLHDFRTKSGKPWILCPDERLFTDTKVTEHSAEL